MTARREELGLGPVSENSKYEIFDFIEPSASLRESWQRSINVLAKATNVPAALIMRVHSQEIEVFLKSQTDGNVYEMGERAQLDTGLYCETVMSTGQELLVLNALIDPKWDDNPDIALDMISYCGLPLLWPTGAVFGTICILDTQENPYSDLCRELLEQFREIIQAGLSSLYENHQLSEAKADSEKANQSLEQLVDERTRELQRAKSDADTSERTLHAVIDAIPAMINAKDRHSRYIFMNRYQADLYGTTPSKAVGKTASEIVGESHGNLTRAIDEEIFQTNTAKLNYEESWHDFNGDQHTLLTTKAPLHDKSGVPANVVTVSLDISNRKRAEIEALAAKEHAEKSNQAKSTFLATMSHEFRTHLNAILGFSELIRSQSFGPLGSDKYDEYANGIHDSGAHLLTLINDILNISAIEARKRHTVKESINIKDLLSTCLRNVVQDFENRGISLSLKTADGLPPLYADKRSIVQIVQNLLSNALKFTNQNGTVEISAFATDQEICIEVSDTGIGIPTDQLPTILEPFSQSHLNPDIAQEGTGLGLAIVNSLVDFEDGNLNIESEVGKGTVVSLTFPNAKPIESKQA